MFFGDQAGISFALGLSLSSECLLFSAEREKQQEETCSASTCTVMAVHPREVAVGLIIWSQLLDQNLSSVKATFQGYANAAAPNHLFFFS